MEDREAIETLIAIQPVLAERYKPTTDVAIKAIETLAKVRELVSRNRVVTSSFTVYRSIVDDQMDELVAILEPKL